MESLRYAYSIALVEFNILNFNTNKSAVNVSQIGGFIFLTGSGKIRCLLSEYCGLSEFIILKIFTLRINIHFVAVRLELLTIDDFPNPDLCRFKCLAYYLCA